MHPRFLNAVAAQYSTVGSGWTGWTFSPRTVSSILIANNRLIETSAVKPMCTPDGGIQESVGYGTTPGRPGVSLGICSNIFKSEVTPFSSASFPSFDDVAEVALMDPAMWAAWRAQYPAENYSNVPAVPLHIVRAYDPAVVPGTNLEKVIFEQLTPVDPSHVCDFSFFVVGSPHHKRCTFDFILWSGEAAAQFRHIDPSTGAIQTRFTVDIPGGVLTRVDMSLWAPGPTNTTDIVIWPKWPDDPVPANVDTAGGAIHFPALHVGMYMGGWTLNSREATPTGGFGIGSFGIGPFGGYTL